MRPDLSERFHPYHRDPTLMTMLYILQQLLKKRIDLSIRQEGAKIN